MHRPEQEKIRTITGTDFHHYSVVAFGSKPCLIRFQLAFPLSQARTPWTRRARLRSSKACVRAHDRSLPHLVLKCHILEMQFALQISSYKVACHAQNSVNDRTHRTVDACRNERDKPKGDHPNCNQFQCYQIPSSPLLLFDLCLGIVSQDTKEECQPAAGNSR